MVEHFSSDELRALIFEIGDDAELIAVGSNKKDMIQATIGWYNRRKRLPDLLEACRRERPRVMWPL